MSYPALSTNPDPRRIAEAVNSILRGKTNNVTTVTLTANAATTTLTDSRIGGGSFIGFSPTTSNAAAGMTALYVSAKAKGSATLTHANNAQTDRTYDVVIVG